MAFMRTVGDGHTPPAHAIVLEEDGEYLIELDVADFDESELTVEALGRRLAIRGDQTGARDDAGEAFRLRERLEETFLLPEDALLDEIKVLFRHGTLEIHAPRAPLVPRRLPIEHASYAFNRNAEPC
jgi:HSP20 family molecular chaperone IbpA